MESRNRKLIRAAAWLAVSMIAGCYGDDEPYVTLVPVEGTVTENGKPFEEAIITFVPEGGNRDQTTGVDRTGQGGTFKAMYRNRPGLAPGKYKVVVSKTSHPPAAKMPEAFKDLPYMAKRAGLLKEEAPADYSDPKKTPLSLEVSQAGEKGLLFDVKDLRRGK
ncbi:carboxypeptidase-like regulatory domain-containing protein [Singulisphaera sp. PoT]|uniref:carboxypeptidase-like regulatory domain-containing protein n=1 Tax=Singulisphaera sp. PoT TaxID=3411797 RepID=UPI003BF4FFEB